MTNNEKFVEMLYNVADNDEDLVDAMFSIAVEKGLNLDGLEDSEYETESKKFLRENIMPSIKNNFANEKDEETKKLWSDFGKRVQGQLGDGFSRSWEELKKKYGKPLQMSDADIAWEAEQQFTSPEIIKTEIDKAWAAHAKEEGRKSRERIEMQTAKDRTQLQKDFESGKLDGQTIFGNGAIGHGLARIARFAGDNPFAKRVVEQNKRNVLQGTDESVIDDALVDLGQGVVEYGVGKGIGKVMKGAPALTQGAVIGAGSMGVGNVAGQFADIGRGEQEEFDAEKAAEAAGTGALFSLASSGILGVMLKVPALRGYALRTLRKMYGKNPKEPITPLEQERKTFKELTDAAKKARKAGMRKNATQVQKGNMMEAEEAAKKYADDPRVKRVNEDVDYNLDPNGPVFNELTEKQIKYQKSRRKAYPDAPPTKRQYELATPEEQAYYRKTYPETFKSYSAPKPAEIGKVGKLENAATTTARIGANVYQRKFARDAGYVEDKKRKESENGKHERWQKGYATFDEMKTDEYKEWKKQSLEGWRY